MPTLIQEDGTGLTNSNTYLTLAEYEVYLTDRGLTDARSNTAKESAIISAKDWVESKSGQFSGVKMNRDNALSWPRGYASAHGYEIDGNTIPQELKDAQSQLAYDSASYSLFAVGDGREVIREKVDVIEVEYGKSGNANVQSVFAKAEAFLKVLYKQGGAFGTIRV